MKVILPIWAWMFLPESTLKFTWPALALVMAAGSYLSLTSVPTLGLGIKPLGPKIFPNAFNLGKNSGVVNNI